MLKLSEAIRLGAMMKRQWFGDFYNSDYTASCAVGAAMDAAGIRSALWSSWPKQWVSILKYSTTLHCPECGRITISCVAHLNDDHQWTRERIADFIETLEKDEVTKVAKPDEHAVTQ